MEDIKQLQVAEMNGQTAMNTVYLVLFIVIILVMIPLGFLIVAKVQNQIPTDGLTTNQTATLNQIKEDSAQNFQFMNLIPFVLIATGVLAAVIGIVMILRGA